MANSYIRNINISVQPPEMNQSVSKIAEMISLRTYYRILSVTTHINCIVVCCLINVVYLNGMCLYQVMMTLHFLNDVDVANYAESTQNLKLRHNR